LEDAETTLTADTEEVDEEEVEAEVRVALFEQRVTFMLLYTASSASGSPPNGATQHG
jgi:hypothetical protein